MTATAQATNLFGEAIASAASPSPRLRASEPIGRPETPTSPLTQAPQAFPVTELAETARHLLALRATSDPQAVRAQRMTQADADRRQRIMTAVVRLWLAVETLQPIPALPATWSEMQDDLDDAARRASDRAAKDSGNPADNARNARLARTITGLAFQHRPWSDREPMATIAMLHRTELAWAAS